MPNDAKLGLVVGMALVLVIATIFFRHDSQAVATNPINTPAVMSTYAVSDSITPKS